MYEKPVIAKILLIILLSVFLLSAGCSLIDRKYIHLLCNYTCLFCHASVHFHDHGQDAVCPR